MPINWYVLNETSLFEKGDLTCLADQYVNMVNVLGAPLGAVALLYNY